MNELRTALESKSKEIYNIQVEQSTARREILTISFMLKKSAVNTLKTKFALNFIVENDIHANADTFQQPFIVEEIPVVICMSRVQKCRTASIVKILSNRFNTVNIAASVRVVQLTKHIRKIFTSTFNQMFKHSQVLIGVVLLMNWVVHPWCWFSALGADMGEEKLVRCAFCRKLWF